MSWVRLDDAFYRNDKQLAMTDAAFRLFVCSLSSCMAEKEPIGFMSTTQARALARYLGKGPSIIKQLVALRAWEVVPDGFLVHDFDEFVDVGSRDRVRKARELKRVGNNPVTPPGGGGNADVTAPRGRARAPVPVPVPVPRVVITTSNVSLNTPEALAICQAHEELGAIAIPRDLVDAEGLVAEFRAPRSDQFVAAMRVTVDYRRDHDLRPIARVVGFRETFKRLHAQLRDADQRPRSDVSPYVSAAAQAMP